MTELNAFDLALQSLSLAAVKAVAAVAVVGVVLWAWYVLKAWGDA